MRFFFYNKIMRKKEKKNRNKMIKKNKIVYKTQVGFIKTAVQVE